MNKTENLVIHPIHYCQGQLSKNRRCDKQVQVKGSYCSIHLQPKYPKPDDCLICSDPIDDVKTPLVCGHWMHRTCVLKWKPQCPVCRTGIKLTKTERRAYNKYNADNIVYYILEEDDDDEVVAIYQLDDIENNEAGYMVVLDSIDSILHALRNIRSEVN